MTIFLVSTSCGAKSDSKTLLILGDSLTAGIQLIDIRDRIIVEQGWSDVVVDGLAGRRIADLDYPDSTRGIQTYTAHIGYGLRPDAMIVALGVNDIGWNMSRTDLDPVQLYDQIIRQMLDLIGPIPVAWVNIVRWDESYYLDESRVFNGVLAKVALDYPNMIIGDWFTTKNVATYWDDDYLHPNATGYAARGEMYRQLADNLFQKLQDGK